MDGDARAVVVEERIVSPSMCLALPISKERIVLHPGVAALGHITAAADEPRAS